MRGLMKICRNWGSSECRADSAPVWFGTQGESGFVEAQESVNQQIDQMDEYCRTCPKRYFRAETSRCFVCEKGHLEPAALSQIKFTSGTEYLYECPECGTSFYSYEELM